MRIAKIVTLGILMQLAPLPALADVCTYDFRIGGPDALVNYSYTIRPKGPQEVRFQYFGAITEVQLYQGGLLYYRGAPIDRFNAPGEFRLLVLKGNPGDVVKITTDWQNAPNGCT